MFRTVPLSIISSFSLYTQQWYIYIYIYISYSLRAGSGRNQFYPDPASKLSTNLYDVYHCVLTACKQDRDGTSSILILLASCQQTCMTYTIAVYTVKN